MAPEYVRDWLVAFVCTQLVEVPLYRRLLGCTWARAFGATALTHPLLWFVVFPHWHAPYVLKLVIAALGVWLLEALYFRPTFGLRRSLWVALLANVASLLVGLVSRAVLGAP